jgi:mono/diheme cytochrome c family protein
MPLRGIFGFRKLGARQGKGCPILAHVPRLWPTMKRLTRKGGIPQRPAPSSFLKVTAIAVVLAAISACRIDMHVQPRINPLAKSDFFPDQRGARPLVEGTVARGDLRADTYFYTGKIGSTPGDYMPFPVTREVLDRGRERFDIFCAPCHSRLGDGNGFVPSRGFSRKPPSYHTAQLEKAPLGYFYDVITNGFGIMPDYGSQIPPRDRWNIVAYIRALQLSQNATKADVPAGQAIPSEPPNFEGPPGSGATLPVIAPGSEAQKKEEAK